MSLEAVIERILAQGNAEANATIDSAKKEKNRMLQEARKRGQDEISRRLAEAKIAAERLKVQEMARSDLESRKIVLGAQKDVLEKVKNEVLNKLSSPEIRKEILQALLEKYKEDWRAGKVYCKAEDENQVKATVGDRFGGNIDCDGGIIIESRDGTRRIDLRFETILQDLWEDSVKEVAELLWPRR